MNYNCLKSTEYGDQNSTRTSAYRLTVNRTSAQRKFANISRGMGCPINQDISAKRVLRSALMTNRNVLRSLSDTEMDKGRSKTPT
jgi:hypothetical protein